MKPSFHSIGIEDLLGIHISEGNPVAGSSHHSLISLNNFKKVFSFFAPHPPKTFTESMKNMAAILSFACQCLLMVFIDLFSVELRDLINTLYNRG